MLDLADALKAEPARSAAKGAGAKSIAAPKTFTMGKLRRLIVWAAAAAGAVAIAALASRSDIGLDRIALIRHGPATQTQVATRTFDAQAETQRLAEAVRGLSTSDEQIKSRLAAVERNMDDVTGSITKQIEAAKAPRRADDGPSVAATAALTASLAAPAAAPAVAIAAAAPAPAATAPAVAASAPTPHTQYAVDIGSGVTIDALRARWLTVRAAHPQFFEGLEPLVGVKEVPHANRVELRLLAGPIAEPAAAAKLCAALALFGLFCQPTLFDGQHLAVR